MAQMLVLRPKRPLVAIDTAEELDTLVVTLFVEDDQNLQTWQADLCSYIDKLRQSSTYNVAVPYNFIQFHKEWYTSGVLTL